MRNVRVRHQQTVVANAGFEFIFCTAVNGYTLANGSIVANFSSGFFSYKFQVLWYGANNGTGKNFAAFSNAAIRHDHGVRHDVGVIANGSIIMNNGKRIYGYIVAELCIRMNGCERG